MEHLLKLSSLTPDEIIHILDVADEYKRLHKAGTDPKDLQGKAIALMFGKHSTRTRTSLEVGIYQMGGLGTYLISLQQNAGGGADPGYRPRAGPLLRCYCVPHL